MAKINVGLCLDETGSMGPLQDATISGVNEYVKDIDKGARLTLTMFSDTFGQEPVYRVYCEDTKPTEFVPLTETTYKPRGNTPLYDAIGHTIEKMDAALAKAKTKPTALLVIQTDGQENASKEYTRQQIADLVQAREKDGWKIIYLGANQDAFTAESAAMAMGLTRGSSFSYAGATTDSAYSALGHTTASVAANPRLTSAQAAHSLKVDHDKKVKKAAPTK